MNSFFKRHSNLMYILLLAQVILFSILAIANIIITNIHHRSPNLAIFSSLISLVMMALIIFVHRHEERWLNSPKPVRRFFLELYYVLMTISLFFLLLIESSILFGFLHNVLHLNFNIAYIIILAYWFFMYIPTVTVITKNIHWLITRLILLAYILFQNIVGSSTLFHTAIQSNKILSAFTTSGVADALVFITVVAILMINWGYQLPKFSYSKQSSWITNLFLLLFSVWYVIFNAFSSSEKWSTVLFKYDFSMTSPTLKMTLQGLEPGIAEEWLWRFAVALLLLVALKRSKHLIFSQHFIEWTIGIDGVLFGLWHLDNILGGQNVLGTVDQVISAIAAGWIFMVLYLYTNNLLTSMLFHFGVDSLSFIASGSTLMSKPDAFEWQSTIVLVIVFGAITVFMLTGNRRKVIEANVAEMIKTTPVN